MLNLTEILTKHSLWLKGDSTGIKADLHGADLRRADLRRADLREADLREADLREADLRGADLREADLHRADLRGANLYGANLYGADLREAEDLLMSYTSICPEGTLIGWKKCRDNIIVKLEIPLEAKRSNATGRKCRAEFVKVLEIFGNTEKGISQHDGITEYKVGEIVKCDFWCEDRWQECAGGIHFFLTRLEAENY
jgi:hypothetical protein